ncbi:UNVERIFIED_ORG: hypothetical protein QE446_005078 [Rhizobium sp. SORGH_AS260]|nr:hypothetical protein [Rhizobium sp. SORGH_AS_0285]MDP9757154.1 hypothetical protein [Rhizobium sp. SORGH_AS_0260]MDR6084107.1 hypothetical protein [Agrobacterium sp. SORGH_AS_0440]
MGILKLEGDKIFEWLDYFAVTAVQTLPIPKALNKYLGTNTFEKLLLYCASSHPSLLPSTSLITVSRSGLVGCRKLLLSPEAGRIHRKACP